jgi:hypothetical protein
MSTTYRWPEAPRLNRVHCILGQAVSVHAKWLYPGNIPFGIDQHIQIHLALCVGATCSVCEFRLRRMERLRILFKVTAFYFNRLVGYFEGIVIELR